MHLHGHCYRKNLQRFETAETSPNPLRCERTHSESAENMFLKP